MQSDANMAWAKVWVFAAQDTPLSISPPFLSSSPFWKALLVFRE